MSQQLGIQFPDPRQEAQQQIADHADLFREDFGEWLAANWSLYEAFEREAAKIVARGRRHYGANTIIEYLRHQTLLMDSEFEWKVNDKWTSSIARLYALMNPTRAALFEFRERADGVVKAPTTAGVA